MKRTKHAPKTGQFVAVWEHRGLPWAITVKHSPTGMLERNTLKENEWEPLVAPWPRDAIFFTVPLN